MQKQLNSQTCVPIELGDRSYSILIGSGQLSNRAFVDLLPSAKFALVVTNPTVSALFGSKLLDVLRTHYSEVHLLELPDGEEYKNWQTLNLIFDELLMRRCDRKTVLFALGGGVIGDMTGFAAASYMRGVPFVQVPTTLLSQVDSSVGGKTGINHPSGKNMIGAFYQPRLVLCDIDTLKTLPQRELSAGLAEVIKYGPIADSEFLNWIESNIDLLMTYDPEALAYAVKRSCEIKAWVVAHDEREAGLRAILNFGHTFGHAIETGMGYGAWLHGEAVGCGMVMAANLSQRMGLIGLGYVRRLTRLIERAGLPVRGPQLKPGDANADAYLSLMRVDKKAEAGEIKFVLIDEAGKAQVCGAPDEMVREVINTCCI